MGLIMNRFISNFMDLFLSFTDNSMLLHKVCALSITVKSLCACQCDCAKRLMSNCFVVNMHVTHEP